MKITLTYHDRPITVIEDEHGVPMWVADEVCAVLGITNPRDTLRKVLDDDEKGVATVYTPGGPQRKATINESGLYSLILRSRKPEAKAFKRWVTHEVLPQIRKTGTYSTTPSPEPVVTYEAPSPPTLAPKTSTKAKLEIELAALREAFVVQTRALEALARQVAELAKARPALPAPPPRQVRCHRSLPVDVPCVETEGPAGRFLWLNQEAFHAYRTTGVLPQTH